MKEEKENKKRIAVVRIRGEVHVSENIEETMRKLKLTRVNHCVIADSGKAYMGMIKKVKDYVTYGEISPETMDRLITKRGFLKGDVHISEEYLKKNTNFKTIKDFVKDFMSFKSELKDLEMKRVFRLEPPKKGYERGGIKHPFSRGGVLGYRGEKINILLEKMI